MCITGGIFSSDFVRDTMACSNGAIYNLYEWPFNPEDIYFYPVKTEAEYESMMTDYEDCTYASRSSVADSISDGYLVISPRTNSSNWTMEFQVPDVLSGTYDVCAVVLPRIMPATVISVHVSSLLLSVTRRKTGWNRPMISKTRCKTTLIG